MQVDQAGQKDGVRELQRHPGRAGQFSPHRGDFIPAHGNGALPVPASGRVHDTAGTDDKIKRGIRHAPLLPAHAFVRSGSMRMTVG